MDGNEVSNATERGTHHRTVPAGELRRGAQRCRLGESLVCFGVGVGIGVGGTQHTARKERSRRTAW